MKKSNVKGNIFNIQKYSIHDGPGIRTTVFFKGCPLSCKWCHNPESLSREQQLLMDSNKCTLCGRCVRKCPEKALKIEDGVLILDKDKCTFCGVCENVCTFQAIKVVGEKKSVDEVMYEILKDKIFYEVSGGGVTFSGGEPFFQSEFLVELAKECKENDLHVTIDTSGMTAWENIEKVLPYTDLILYDLKIVDREKHLKYTGATNDLIIANLKKLRKEDVEIYLRLPLIRGINDSDKDIDGVLETIKGIKNISQINLLKYHTMGKEKYQRLDLEYELKGDEIPLDKRVNEIKKRFNNEGYNVIIGG